MNAQTGIPGSAISRGGGPITMSRVLFLYATSNSGHQRAADAIRKSLLNIAPQVRTTGVDFFTYHYPTLGPFIFKMYLDLLQSIPHIWDYLYDSPDVASLTGELRQFFNFLNIPKLNQIIRSFAPDLIVCTQAVPAGFIASEKQRGKLAHIPFLATITDFVANPYWPNHYVDCYFVPETETKDQLLNRHIPEHCVKVTGIPIDSAFGQKMSKALIRQKFGLRMGLPTVLIMGGSQGLGQITRAVRELVNARKAFQVIVITGHNRALYRQLYKKYSTHRNVLLLSHIRNVAKIMDAADILISKPGGLTSSEALVKGLPMIILSPLPGQEERNAAFLVRNGLAERCENPEELPAIADSFFSHPGKLLRFQARALRMSRPYASDEIASQILRFLQ